MLRLDSFRERLHQSLSRVTPEKLVGSSGLGMLCAASTLALVPTSDQVVLTALMQWLGSLGLNVLAGVLQQEYQNLLSQPTRDEQERLAALAQALTKHIRRQAELRCEIGAFLDEGNLDAFRIAGEVVQGNPAVHGWLLVRIYEDVTRYRADFDQIHMSLAEMKGLIEQLSESIPLAFQPPRLALPAGLPKRLQRLAQRNLDNFLARPGQINPQLHPRRAMQDELEDFLLGRDKGCILLIGDTGAGKSSLLYHSAKWAVESEIPLIYLDAGQRQLQDTDWLVTAFECRAEDLPSLPVRYEQHFGTAPLVLLDTIDQLVGPGGMAFNILSILLQWSESARMICASRSCQAERLHELLPHATMKVIPKLTETEVETVIKRMGKQFIRDEQLLELISIPLHLYLWLKTGAKPLGAKGFGLASLWMVYWNEVIHGNLAAPTDWENFTETEFASAKMDLLSWLVQRMFQQGSYQVPYQQIASKLLAKHVCSVAYDALIRAGTISTYIGHGTTVTQFLHQSLFEFATGRRILDLDQAEAKHAIDQLLARVDEPFCRPIIDGFAYLAHQQRPDLEDYLYHGLVVQLGSSKIELLKAQRENWPSPPSASAVSWGIDYVLQDLVDHWGARMCGTLDSGSPDRPEDGEVASTIASVFERNPRLFAVPSLIAGMRKYRKRGRFIGALGKTGTEEARSALLAFTQEHMACPTDKSVFRYLAAALGEACGEEGVPLLRAIRDGDYDDTAKYNACRALQDLGQEDGASPSYQLEHILAALRLVDEEGRPSDWSLLADMAVWLRNCGSENQLVQATLPRIISALEAALDHMHNGARKPVAAALGELGSAQTFDLLSKRLAEGVEPSQGVVLEILSALVRLAERGQVDPAMTVEAVQERFSRIRLQHSALAEVIRDIGPRILEHLRRKSQ
jgi:hypothetical protein